MDFAAHDDNAAVPKSRSCSAPECRLLPNSAAAGQTTEDDLTEQPKDQASRVTHYLRRSIRLGWSSYRSRRSAVDRFQPYFDED
jgi:hypothetical protein